VVSLLLSRGANANAKADDGRTPMDLAQDHGHDAVAALLLDHGAGPGAGSQLG
jgi:ankyrin repeat protein